MAGGGVGGTIPAGIAAEFPVTGVLGEALVTVAAVAAGGGRVVTTAREGRFSCCSTPDPEIEIEEWPPGGATTRELGLVNTMSVESAVDMMNPTKGAEVLAMLGASLSTKDKGDVGERGGVARGFGFPADSDSRIEDEIRRYTTSCHICALSEFEAMEFMGRQQ